jgi:hypothetical protein
MGITADLVEHLEHRALSALLSQPAGVEAAWQVEELCARLGLAWDDERLPLAISAWYPNTRASFTRLAAWLMLEKGRLVAESSGRPFTPPQGIPHFEQMVVATLGRYGDLPAETLAEHVRTALATNDHVAAQDFSVAERVRVLGPAIPLDNGSFRLPDDPIEGLGDDRHIRSLNALIGAMQRLGTARIAALTAEVNRRLPRAYRVNEQFVRTWLTRHPELFNQTDEDRYKLATLDLDILTGLATSWLPGGEGGTGGAPGMKPVPPHLQRQHERMATDLVELLREHGPLPLARIRSAFYGRFVGGLSVDAVIAQDAQGRFIRLTNGAVGLRELHQEDEAPREARPKNPSLRGPAWHRTS